MTVAALIGLGRLNYGWFVWATIIVVMNIVTRRHKQAPEFPALSASRWALAALAAIMLVLTFTISPFQTN
jgi:uncharacterized membrane protein